MGQNPRAIVLSCSDSRVPPELIFDQKRGELFTVRSAGETLSPQSIGSIEFAIEKLVKLEQDIHPRLKGKFNEQAPSKNLKAESWLNVRGVAKAVASGKVEIKLGLYDLESGAVSF